MVHHGNEEVEKDNDVDDREGPEHEEAEEPGELFDAGQLKVVQIDQPKNGPKQSLSRFPEARKTQR